MLSDICSIYDAPAMISERMIKFGGLLNRPEYVEKVRESCESHVSEQRNSGIRYQII
jgi:hypothetical protein